MDVQVLRWYCFSTNPIEPNSNATSKVVLLIFHIFPLLSLIFFVPAAF
jgi:hypothetical protein